MGSPNLTKVLITALIATFLITVLFGAYSEFVVINNVTVEAKYAAAFNSIGAQYGGFGGIAATASDQGLVKNILGFGKSAISGTINVFVVGLDAMGSFFSMIPIVGNIVTAIGTVIPEFKALLGLFTIIFGVYIAMSYIKSASNKSELP
jgi:hypothetical protein